MITGLFVAERSADFQLALCLGGPESASSWFLFESGGLQCLAWGAFHADYQLVGIFPELAGYHFTSPPRATADWHAGVFAAGFAAALAQWKVDSGLALPS